MITANEAKENVRKMREAQEKWLEKSVNDWLENVVSQKIMATSKDGYSCLSMPVRISSNANENEEIAARATNVLSVKYGYCAECKIGSEPMIAIKWGE